MKAPGLNLGEWLRRLGIRRPGWAPEINEMIQPVMVVHDDSALVPPLLVATAVAGGNFLAGAGRFAAWQFNCRAPGGAYLRGVRVGTGAIPVFCYYRLLAAPVALVAGVITATNYNMGPTPALSAIQLGEVLASTFSVTDPQGRFVQNSSYVLDELIFVPPGQTFYFEIGNAAQDVTLTVVWQEIPV